MKSISIAGIIVAAVVSLSAITVSTAVARCVRTYVYKAGTYNESLCGPPGGENLFIVIEEGFQIEGPTGTRECGKVPNGAAGGVYTDNLCTTPGTGEKRWLLVYKAIPGMYPMFKPAKAEFPITLLGTSGTTKLATTSGSRIITCSKTTSTGSVTSEAGVGDFLVKFTGCKLKTETETCAQKSVGAGTEEIATKGLLGLLSSVKTAEAPSGVGLLLEPESSTKVVATLASTKCASETSLSGSFAAEAAPIAKSQATDKLVFALTGKSQKISEVDQAGFTIKPALEMFTAKASIESTEVVTYAEAVEIG